MSKQANSPGLFDALNLFRRRFRFVVFGTLLGLGAAAAYFCMSKTKYEGSFQFLVDVPENLPGRTGEPTQGETTIIDDVLADVTMILESRAVIAAALEKGDLKDLESIQNALAEDEDEVEYIFRNLRVLRGGEGQRRSARVITVRLLHSTPNDAADILNAIIASYKDFIGEQSGETGDQAIDALREDMNKAKDALDASSARYAAFRKATPELLGNQTDRINPYQAQVETWNTSLAEVRSLKIETLCRIETVRKLFSQKVGDEYGFDRVELLQKITGKTGRPEVAEAVKAEVNQLWQMMLRERDLLAQYGPGHPLVQRTRAGIAKMKELLAGKRRQMERDFALMLASDLRELKIRQIEETKLLNEAMKAAHAMDEAIRKDESFLADLDHSQRLYDKAKERFGEAVISKSHGGLITKTLAPVTVGEPITAEPALVLAMGLMVGLFMGLGLAVIVDHLDAGAVPEAEVQVNRQPRAMHESKLHHVRPNVGAAV